MAAGARQQVARFFLGRGRQKGSGKGGFADRLVGTPQRRQRRGGLLRRSARLGNRRLRQERSFGRDFVVLELVVLERVVGQPARRFFLCRSLRRHSVLAGTFWRSAIG